MNHATDPNCTNPISKMWWSLALSILMLGQVNAQPQYAGTFVRPIDLRNPASPKTGHSAPSKATSEHSDEAVWEVLTAENVGEPVQTFTLAHLFGFSVSLDGDTARLRWKTTREYENAGFVIEQSRDGAPYRAVAYFPGGGTLAIPRHYGYELRGLSNGTYQFRLRQVEWNHRFGYSRPVHTIIGNPGVNAIW